MSVDVIIKNGGAGVPSCAYVDEAGAVYVNPIPFPPILKQPTQPFAQYFTDDGTSTGSNDMGVDGSVTAQDFYVQADSQNDLYIKEISVLVGYGTSGQPYQFADSTALTNGVRIFYENTSGEKNIVEAIKDNSDFLRLSTDDIVLNNWEVRGVGALNDYGYIINIDITKFSPDIGVKLDAGTTQRLIVRIQDDATNADIFNMSTRGFERVIS